MRMPVVKQEQFSFDDYPFLDPDFNENIPNVDQQPDANGQSRRIITFKDDPTQTYWTDMFLYWLDDTEVVEGSVLAFFQDISIGRA
jgi:hypothetical protein